MIVLIAVYECHWGKPEAISIDLSTAVPAKLAKLAENVSGVEMANTLGYCIVIHCGKVFETLPILKQIAQNWANELDTGITFLSGFDETPQDGDFYVEPQK